MSKSNVSDFCSGLLNVVAFGELPLGAKFANLANDEVNIFIKIFDYYEEHLYCVSDGKVVRSI